MPLDTYEIVPAVEHIDALAEFRQQAKAELQEKSERGKMSDAALAKFRAINAQEKTDAIDAERFRSALRSVIVTPTNLQKLIERCNTSVPVEQSERRAVKLLWWITAGYLLGREIDSPTMISFFSTLTMDEARMSDSQFAVTWVTKTAETLKTQRTKQGIITDASKPERPCKSGKKCLRFEKRKPAPAKGNGEYCGSACRASDRARAKRGLATIPTVH